MRTGASFVTTLRPTGLRHSSPSSEMKYAATSHHGLTRVPVPSWANRAAGTSTRNANAMKNSPQANFAGLEGSREPSRIQSHAKAGARRMTKIGWTDWNHDEGKSNPRTERRRVSAADTGKGGA